MGAKCPICGKVLKNEKGLEIHTRMVHPGETKPDSSPMVEKVEALCPEGVTVEYDAERDGVLIIHDTPRGKIVDGFNCRDASNEARMKRLTEISLERIQRRLAFEGMDLLEGVRFVRFTRNP